MLGKLGFDLDTVRLELERQIGKGPETVLPSLIPFTPRVKKTLALAAKEARALNHTSVATEHILLGLIREGDGVAARVLLNLGADTEKTRNQVLEELTGRDTYMPPTTESPKPQCATIDITKRYDVYCNEPHQQVVYRNVMFKGAKTLFRNHEFDLLSGFMELEDGKTIFIARTSLIKFCEHGVTPKAEKMPPSP